eukprot:6461957-Amphidinium_carterae.1
MSAEQCVLCHYGLLDTDLPWRLSIKHVPWSVWPVIRLFTGKFLLWKVNHAFLDVVGVRQGHRSASNNCWRCRAETSFEEMWSVDSAFLGLRVGHIQTGVHAMHNPLHVAMDLEHFAGSLGPS